MDPAAPSPAPTPAPAPAPPILTPPAAAASGWPGQQILDTSETARVLHAAWSGDPAVVVPSPPGAGKTRLVALLAAALAHRAELRVGIAAQTREQVAERASGQQADVLGEHREDGAQQKASDAPRLLPGELE